MLVAIIPARKNSIRIKKKNIKSFFGKTMLTRAIDLVKKTKIFDYICVTTDDLHVKKICEKKNVSLIIDRPKKLSSNKISTQNVIKHACEYLKKIKKLNFKYVCCLYPCTPLLNPEDLVISFKTLKNNPKKFVYPVIRYRHPIQRAFKLSKNLEPKFYNIKNTFIDTSKFSPSYHDSGQFYFGTYENWISKKKFMHIDAKCLELPFYRAVDIDNKEDWKIAEIFYRSKKF